MNQRPSGYEPDELPNCSTPHRRVLKFKEWKGIWSSINFIYNLCWENNLSKLMPKWWNLVDTLSWGGSELCSCGFKSRLRHHFCYNITMFGGNNLLHITEIPISLVCFLHCIAFFLGHFGLFSINFMMLNLLNNQIIHDLFVIFGIFFGTLIYINNTKKIL